MSLKKHLLSFFAFLVIVSIIIVSGAQSVAAKSVTKLTAFYKDSETKKSETYTVTDGDKLIKEQKIDYDIKGNKTASSTTEYKDSKKVATKVYKYNTKEQVISYINTKYSGKSNKLVNMYTYKYYSNQKKKQVNHLIKRNGKNVKLTKTYYKSTGKKSKKYVTTYSKGKKRVVTQYSYKNNKAKKVKRTYYYNIHTKSKKTLSKAYAAYNYKTKKYTYYTKTGKRNAIIKNAKKYVGKQYRAGGSTPKGFDCSGYTSYVYKTTLNKKIGRTTTSQNKKGKYVKNLSTKNLKPGDILFWGSKSSPYHVGIYVGNGKYIHASTPATGVKKDSFKNFKPSYAKRMIL